MSLEQLIQANTEALIANTAAILGAKGGGAAVSTTTEKVTKGTKTKDDATAKETKKGYEAKHTKAEAQAAVNEVKELKGVPAAKALIKAVGCEKLADVEKAEDIDKLYELAKEALGEGGSDDGDGDGI